MLVSWAVHLFPASKISKYFMYLWNWSFINVQHKEKTIYYGFTGIPVLFITMYQPNKTYQILVYKFYTHMLYISFTLKQFCHKPTFCCTKSSCHPLKNERTTQTFVGIRLAWVFNYNCFCGFQWGIFGGILYLSPRRREQNSAKYASQDFPCKASYSVW